MKISLVQFITLDGVSQGPGSPSEDTSDAFGAGGWLVPHIDATFVERTSEWLDMADGLLLGRRTYEAFARDWPQISDPTDPFAERMNRLPKYVVSRTLDNATWDPTTVLTGDPVEAVAGLKARPGRELQVHGSARLGDSLLAADLVDTLRLVVTPTVLRAGRRLMAGAGPSIGLQLIRHEVTSTGLLLLEYETTGRADQGEYRGVAAFA